MNENQQKLEKKKSRPPHSPDIGFIRPNYKIIVLKNKAMLSSRTQKTRLKILADNCIIKGDVTELIKHKKKILGMKNKITN